MWLEQGTRSAFTHRFRQNKTKKSPEPEGTGLLGQSTNPPEGEFGTARSELLGFGSCAGSGRSSSVSGSLGGVSSRSGSVGSSRSGVGSDRSCGFHSGWSWGFYRSRSWCWSGFFLLATSGECSSSDQGGQNERVLHLDFPSWTDRILKSHGVRLVKKPLYALARCTWIAPFWRNNGLYWHLVNTD